MLACAVTDSLIRLAKLALLRPMVAAFAASKTGSVVAPSCATEATTAALTKVALTAPELLTSAVLGLAEMVLATALATWL